MSSQIKLKSNLFVLIVGVVLIFYLMENYRGWNVFLIGLGGALLLGYLWVRSLASGLSLIRRVRFGWAQVGDRMEEQFKLINRSLFPALWVEVDYQSTMPDYQPTRATAVGGTGENKWHTEGLCTRRGVFTLGPVILRTGDPLGIFDLTLEHPVTRTVLVTPPVIPLPFIEVAPGGRAGDGRPRRFALEETVAVNGVREYLPGDSMRFIHWPTTARRDKIYLRTLVNTPASDWWIFLDLDQDAKYGQGYETTEEHAVILAASLVDRGIRLGNLVGLITHGESVTWLPPRLGEEHRQSIMQALALATTGDCSLSQLLELARPIFRQNPSVIVITSNMNPAWVDALVPLIQLGAVPTIILLDPASYIPSQNGGGDVSLTPIMNLLAELGVSRYRIDKRLFDRPEARPGQRGKWDWQRSASNRAYLRHSPGDLAWKEI